MAQRSQRCMAISGALVVGKDTEQRFTEILKIKFPN